METQCTLANLPIMTTKQSTVAQTAIEQRGDVMCCTLLIRAQMGIKRVGYVARQVIRGEHRTAFSLLK